MLSVVGPRSLCFSGRLTVSGDISVVLLTRMLCRRDAQRDLSLHHSCIILDTAENSFTPPTFSLHARTG